jgi:class 3 adenylate cyclase
MSFNRETSLSRIREANEALKTKLEIKDFKRDADLEGIGLATAYRVDGVHVYAQILNLPSLLDTGKTESETSHRRVLRFLHVFQRVVHLALGSAGVKKVDFQNERLHCVVYKPFGDEKARIKIAVALANLLSEVLRKANGLHEELPDAQLRVGIESGVAFAVNNGTRGDREPLFLGPPANDAAKLLGGTPGIFLGRAARRALGPAYEVEDPGRKPLEPGFPGTPTSGSRATGSSLGGIASGRTSLLRNSSSPGRPRH